MPSREFNRAGNVLAGDGVGNALEVNRW